MDKLLVSIFSGLGAMLGWGSADTFTKAAVNKLGKLKSIFWVQVIGFLMVLVAMIFVPIDYNISLNLFGLILLSSAIGTSAYYMFYKAFEKGNASIVTPVTSSYAILTVISSYIFLGQRLLPIQFVFIGVVITGVIITSLNFKELNLKKGIFVPGVKEALIAAFIIGAISVPLDDFVLGQANWILVALIWKLSRVIIFTIFILLFRRKTNIFDIRKDARIPLVMVAVCDMLGIFAYNYGLSVGDSIVIAPIASAFAIVTVTLSVLFFKEKLTLNQVVGILLTIGGIVSLSLFS